MTSEAVLIEPIEALCRTCGIFYITAHLLKPIFTSPNDDLEMCEIRAEISAWKLEIKENDEYSQYICHGCVQKFRDLLKFRRICLNVQEKFQHYSKTQPLVYSIDLTSKGFTHKNEENDDKIDRTTPTKNDVNLAAHIQIPKIYEVKSLATKSSEMQSSNIKSTYTDAENILANKSRISIDGDNENAENTTAKDDVSGTAVLHIPKIHAVESNNIDASYISQEQITPIIKVEQFSNVDSTTSKINNILTEDLATTSKHTIFFNNDKASKFSYCTQLSYDKCDATDTISAIDGCNPEPVDQQFFCALCVSSFETVLELFIHNLDHNTDSMFTCPLCGEKFFFKLILTMHLKTHDVSL